MSSVVDGHRAPLHHSVDPDVRDGRQLHGRVPSRRLDRRPVRPPHETAGADQTTLLTENTAPAGSASTAVRPTPVSEGGIRTLPPSSPARVATASASWTQKSGVQAAASPCIITATTSRGTGCWGSPPTKPGRRNIVAGPNDSVSQPNTAP